MTPAPVAVPVPPPIGGNRNRGRCALTSLKPSSGRTLKSNASGYTQERSEIAVTCAPRYASSNGIQWSTHPRYRPTDLDTTD